MLPVVHELLSIKIRAGECIVGITSHYGNLYVITNLGTLYLIDVARS
jgi:translation initiation factor 2B subunit (eIF-2B alpha/beta/delta family)